MRFGCHLGYWGATPPPEGLEVVQEAERLGADSVWTAEAYGSDALTPLAWWGGQTERVGLGTAIAQISARTPTATAMAAMTLDHLSGGRFRLGLGASGPQVVEGWYGQPYPRPLARTREYVDVVRQVLRREAPVTADGAFYQLPHAGGTGLGKPLRPTVHPFRDDLPILLAAEGPKNVALSAEVADGWLPLFFTPAVDDFYREALDAGFAARDGRLPGRDRFEVAATVPVVVHDDVERAADAIRPFVALYVGGMGASSANFHRDMIERLGYVEECATVARLYAEGRRAEAAAAVPTALVQDVALIGSRDAIANRLDEWSGTVVTTILVQGDMDAVRTIADILA